MQKEKKKINDGIWYYILGFIAIAVLLMFTFAPASELFQKAEGGLCMKTCREMLAKLEAEKEEKEKPVRDHVYISIMLSESCILSNLNCPTYKWLADNFDNTDRYMFGDFIYNPNSNHWHRDKPIVDMAFHFYLQQHDKYPIAIWVDPDSVTLAYPYQKIIWIEPRVLTYMSPNKHIPGLTDGTGMVIQNVTGASSSGRIASYHDIMIDGCSEATIGWYPEGKKALISVLDYFIEQCTGELDYPIKQFTPAPKWEMTECDSLSEQYKNTMLKNALNARSYVVGVNEAYIDVEPCIPQIVNYPDKFSTSSIDVITFPQNAEDCDPLDFKCRQIKSDVTIKNSTMELIEICDDCPKWFNDNVVEWLKGGKITEEEFINSYSWVKFTVVDKYKVPDKIVTAYDEPEEEIKPDVVPETPQVEEEIINNNVNATTPAPAPTPTPTQEKQYELVQGVAEWYDISSDNMFYVRANVDGEARVFQLFYADPGVSGTKQEIETIMSACPINSTLEINLTNNDIFCLGSQINR